MVHTDSRLLKSDWKVQSSFGAAWIAGKGKRNADRRVSNRPRFASAAACSAEHARLSAFHHGSSLGTIHRQGAASCHASWDVAERRSVTIRLPAAEPNAVCAGVPALDLSQSSRGPVCSAGRLMPETARHDYRRPDGRVLQADRRPRDLRDPGLPRCWRAGGRDRPGGCGRHCRRNASGRPGPGSALISHLCRYARARGIPCRPAAQAGK